MKRNSKALLIVLIMILCVASMFLVSCGKKYTVTMNDGGQSTTVQVAENETYNLPAPTKNGYDFAGWYATEDFSGDVLTQITVTADITVFAKWEKVYVVNLQLDGGSLSVSSVNLKDGENIYNAVKELIPTKTNAQFDAWMVGNSALNATQTINGADVTLTARYKYKYTVLAYEQKLDGTYEEVEGMVGYEREGVTVTPTLTAKDGFEKVAHSDAINQVRIERDSNNVCKLYFNRKTITVTFKVEYPDGNMADDYVVEVVYGNPVTVPINYTYTGYHLYAWQNTTATKTYKTNSVNYFIDGSQPNSESFVPATNETYYPVWVEGYKDLFGGNDYLFIFEDDMEVCYLVRGTTYFEGYYFADDQEFEIELSGGRLEGAIDTTYNGFYYYDTTRTGSYYNYTNRKFEQNVTLYFDKGNGVTYTEKVNNVNNESKGTYQMNGYEYAITFTSGKLAGQTRHAVLGSIPVTNTSNNQTLEAKVFMFRDETLYAYGRLGRIDMTEKNGLQVTNGYYMQFDGYGNATYEVTVGSNQGKGVYIVVDLGNDEYALGVQQSNGIAYAGTIKCITENIDGKTVTGFMPRNDSIMHTYVGAKGQQLELDGYYGATYTENGKEAEGTYFMTKTQVLTVAQFTSGKTVRKFALSSTKSMGEDVYTISDVLDTYKEYLYASKGTLYYAPLVVIDSNGVGTASVYGYATSGQYVKVSDGTYLYDRDTGKYTYTQTTAYSYTPAVYDSNQNLLAHGVAEDPVKYSLIKSFVFSIDAGTYAYEINYWYSYTDNNNETVELSKTYTTVSVENGVEINYTLVSIDNTSYILSSEGGSLNGKGIIYIDYSKYFGEEIYVIYLTTDKGQPTLLAVKLNEDGTFYLYDNMPRVDIERLSDGSISTTNFIKFDGIETYTYEEVAQDGTKVVYFGSVETTTTKAPVTNALVNVFNGETQDGQKITIYFVSMTSGNKNYFARYNAEMSGTFLNANGEGAVILDGCTYYAQFIASGSAETVTCNYKIMADGEICLIISDTTGVYLKLDLENKEYNYRGSEYGDYLLIDNGNYIKTALRINGYGKVEVVVEGSEQNEPIVGTYTISNGRCVVTYTDGAKTYTYEGKFSTYSTGGKTYKAFLVYHQEYLMSLTDNNGVYIEVDSYGAVVRRLTNGKQEKGNATILTDNVFFYQSDDGTFGCIYTYNTNTNRATVSNYTTYNYYSADLVGIGFDKSGIANYGDGIIRYYYLDGQDVAHIFVYDAQNEQANDYGFVEEASFDLGYTVTIDDVVYNRTTGYKLTFTRQDASKYPITINGNKYNLESLSFRPEKGETYVVDGIVRINGVDFDVKVGRRLNSETQNYELYCSYNLLQFIIEVDFNGEEDASYTIVDMKENAVLYSSSYYYSKYVIEEERKLGVHVDQVGYIEINASYDEEGNVVSSTLNTNFLADSTILDSNGDAINAQEIQYVNSGNVYVFNIEAADGYTYRFNVKIGQSAYSKFYSSYEYSVLSVSRLQILEDEDTGYKVVIGRLVAQKLSIKEVNDNPSLQADLGTIKVADVYYQGEYIQTSGFVGSVTSAIAIYREVTNGKVTRTIYYNIACTEQQSSLDVKLFEYFVVTPEEVSTIYDANGERFIDVRSDHSVMMFYYTQNGVGSLSTVSASVYDETTNAYIIESGDYGFIALMNENGKMANKIEMFTVAKSGADSIYFDASGNILLIKFNDTYYRALGDSYGWQSVGIYEFFANDRSFVIVKTQSTMVTYKLVEIKYAIQGSGMSVAINANQDEIIYVCYENRIYVATSSTYDENSKTYTVITAGGTYTVVVDGDIVNIDKKN